MIETVLDNFIVLYSKNTNKHFVELLQKIETAPATKNVWTISSLYNEEETDHVVNQKIVDLSNYKDPVSNISDIDVLKTNFEQSFKKNNLKFEIQNYTFPFLYDYIGKYGLSVKKIKSFKICEQIKSSDFHNDLDRYAEQKHFYTIIVALNDDYVGGEIQFKNRIGNETIKLSAGDVLIYPANNSYAHRELEVTSGTKYTAIAYF
jgi:hypothetical protein